MVLLARAPGLTRGSDWFTALPMSRVAYCDSLGIDGCFLFFRGRMEELEKEKRAVAKSVDAEAASKKKQAEEGETRPHFRWAGPGGRGVGGQFGGAARSGHGGNVWSAVGMLSQKGFLKWWRVWLY